MLARDEHPSDARGERQTDARVQSATRARATRAQARCLVSTLTVYGGSACSYLASNGTGGHEGGRRKNGRDDSETELHVV
jgi:hypothetical protein